MGEDIIADLDHILPPAQKIDMGGGDAMRQAGGDAVDRFTVERRPPIAAHRGIAADPQEIADPARIAGQRGEKAFLVIADQQPRVRKFGAQRDRAVDYRRRRGAAIDKVAEKNDRCFSIFVGTIV